MLYWIQFEVLHISKSNSTLCTFAVCFLTIAACFVNCRLNISSQRQSSTHTHTKIHIQLYGSRELNAAHNQLLTTMALGLTAVMANLKKFAKC